MNCFASTLCHVLMGRDINSRRSLMASLMDITEKDSKLEEHHFVEQFPPAISTLTCYKYHNLASYVFKFSNSLSQSKL